ncbi:MAG: 50S ribosomal protein L24 [bacterium]
MKEKHRKVQIKKEDRVKVIAGKELGKIGRVLKVFPDSEKAIVEGINFIKKAERPSQKMAKGGIVQKEAPIHLSNLMVVCRNCNRASRLGRKKLDDGFSVRVCKKCGELLDR